MGPHIETPPVLREGTGPSVQMSSGVAEALKASLQGLILKAAATMHLERESGLRDAEQGRLFYPG